MMVFINEATKADKVPRAWFDMFVRTLSPFAPHVGEEMWERLGHTETIAQAEWPRYDQTKLAVATITIAVQVTGKMRGTIEVPADIGKDEAIALAKADETIARHLEGKTIRREIYVPGRLINLVAT
jgi:leucyl-tRNA synthetase